MWLTDLADVLRAAGLHVVEVDGWKTRGYLGQQMSGAKSILCHWTGTNPLARGDYPTLNTILNGTASTPGPLSQTGLGRDGTWYVAAAGLCNHAGTVDRWECSNPNSIGVEAEYHPDQGAWPEVQQRSYERGCAALRAHHGIPLDLVRGHYEAATPYGRKPDPNTLPGGMPGFRQRVAAVNLEDDMSWSERLRNTEGYEDTAAGFLTAAENKIEKLRATIAAIPVFGQDRNTDLATEIGYLPHNFAEIKVRLDELAEKPAPVALTPEDRSAIAEQVRLGLLADLAPLFDLAERLKD